MKQIERLIARLVQLVEDSPGNIVTLIFVVDDKGVPVCWKVEQGRAEGVDKYIEKEVDNKKISA